MCGVYGGECMVMCVCGVCGDVCVLYMMMYLCVL